MFISQEVLVRKSGSRSTGPLVNAIYEAMAQLLADSKNKLTISVSEYATMRGDTVEQTKSHSWNPKYRECRNSKLVAIAESKGKQFQVVKALAGVLSKDLKVSADAEVFQISLVDSAK